MVAALGRRSSTWSSASAISLLLVRYEFPGKRVLSALIDLPLSVSPVVVGLALLLVYNGRDGLVRPAGRGGRAGRSSSTPPAWSWRPASWRCRWSSARSCPVLTRDRRRPGAGRPQPRRQRAADLPGGSPCPSIKWAVVYGVVLSLARSLGEFGAVKIVSGNITGRTQTATLVVEAKYQNFAAGRRRTRPSFLLDLREHRLPGRRRPPPPQAPLRASRAEGHP